MSLILDALNRSRQDEDQVPGLATQHYDSIETGGGFSWRRLSPWLALGTALVVIAWLLLERGGEQAGIQPVPAEQAPTVNKPSGSQPVTAVETTPPSPAESEPLKAAEKSARPAPRPAAVAAPQPVAEPAIEKPEEGGNDLAVSALYAQQDGAQSESVTATPESVKPAVARPGEARPGEARPGEARPGEARPGEARPGEARPGEAVEEQPVDIEKMVSRAEGELENARLEEHPAPFIADLSQQTKDGIPSVFYQRHDYNGNPASSVVVLNGKELRVGGRPAPGIKVEEILPDSVVLSYQGTQFRLRALNSWVNL